MLELRKLTTRLAVSIGHAPASGLRTKLAAYRTPAKPQFTRCASVSARPSTAGSTRAVGQRVLLAGLSLARVPFRVLLSQYLHSCGLGNA